MKNILFCLFTFFMLISVTSIMAAKNGTKKDGDFDRAKFDEKINELLISYIGKQTDVKKIVDAFIKTGYLPHLHKLLDLTDAESQYKTLQLLLITSETEPEYAEMIVKNAYLPRLIELSQNSNESVTAESLNVMTSVLRQYPKSIPLILQLDLARNLKSLLAKHEDSLAVQRSIAKVLFILTQSKEHQLLRKDVKELLPVYTSMIGNPDVEIAHLIASSLEILTGDTNEKYGIVFELKAIKDLTSLLDVQDISIAGPAFNTLINICKKDNAARILHMGLLELLPSLLKHKEDTIIGDACIILTKLFASSETITKELFKTNIPSSIIQILSQTKNRVVQKEAIWTIHAITSTATPQEFATLIDLGVGKAIGKFIVKLQTVNNPHPSLRICLESLHAIIFGCKNNQKLFKLYDDLEDAKTIKVLKHLMENGSEDTKNAADDIIGIYGRVQEAQKKVKKNEL